MCPQPKAVMSETATLLRDMIALLDNMQILVISKKLVNKPNSIGFVVARRYSVVTSLLVVIILHNIRFVTVIGNALHL